MFKKINRIKTEKEFLTTLRFGRKLETDDLMIYIKQYDSFVDKTNELKKMYDANGNFIQEKIFETNHKTVRPLNPSKLGIIVSAKIGKAHDRNKFKRRIRNIMRRFVLQIDSQCIIVKPKDKVTDLKYRNLKDQLNKVFEIESI